MDNKQGSRICGGNTAYKCPVWLMSEVDKDYSDKVHPNCPLTPVSDVVERKDVIEAMMKASTPAFDKNGKPTFLVDYVKVMEEL